MKRPDPVAVIGGGVAGVSCAHALQSAGIEVRLLERAAALGGRCATRLWQGHLIDLGVQYFTAQSAEFKRELLTRLRQFRPIITPILDEHDKLVVSPSGPRFYVLQGNHYLAHVLSHGVESRLSAEVDGIVPKDGGFQILGEDYRAVVCALPGPVASKLLGLAQAPVEYEPWITAMLEYGHDDKDPGRQCYARIAPPGNRVISAGFCENHKAGRIIGNKTVFVVHAAPEFSIAHADDDPDDYLPQIVDEHERMWNVPSGLCRAQSVHVWHYGRPRPATRTIQDMPSGTFLCGDSCSESTVEDVWLDGRRAASDVVKFLRG